MKGEDLFNTVFVSRQVRHLLELSPFQEPLPAKEIINILGLGQKKNAVRLALHRLVRRGVLRKTAAGYSYIPQETQFTGDIADRVWRYIRYKGVFTVMDVARTTRASTRYVYDLLKLYKAKGLIDVIEPRGRANIYTFVNKNRKARPCQKRDIEKH